MSRKHRITLKFHRLEQRAINTASGRRKREYSKMAQEGILGNKEKQLYRSMYEEIYKKIPGFNLSPVEGGDRVPTKVEYREMKLLYDKYSVCF